MRFFWTDIYPGHFDTFWEARSAKRKAIARREVLANPEPMIVRIQGGWGRSSSSIYYKTFGVFRPIYSTPLKHLTLRMRPHRHYSVVECRGSQSTSSRWGFSEGVLWVGLACGISQTFAEEPDGSRKSEALLIARI